MIAILLYGGLILYFLIGIFVARYIAKFGKSQSRKWLFAILTLVIWFLIPYGDVIIGKWYFNRLCEQDAGLHVYRTVEGVDGFYDMHTSKGGALYFLQKHGYNYIEAHNREHLMRYALDDNGELIETEITAPESRYVVEKSSGQPLSLNVKRFKQTIVDRDTGEILAENVKYGYYGGWVGEIMIDPFIDTRARYCPSPVPDISKLYVSVLKPTKTNQ